MTPPTPAQIAVATRIASNASHHDHCDYFADAKCSCGVETERQVIADAIVAALSAQEQDPVLARLIENERERRRKRGAYWTSPEGRAECREVWPDENDGNTVVPLLNALEAAEAALTEARAEIARLSAQENTR